MSSPITYNLNFSHLPQSAPPNPHTAKYIPHSLAPFFTPSRTTHPGYSIEGGERHNRKVVYLIAVVGPGCPLEDAALLVEGKVLDVDVAAAAKDPVAQPHHLACVAHDHVRVDHRRAVLRVCAARGQKKRKRR